MHKIPLTREVQVKRWDFLRTLKPPEHLSIESGKFHMLEQLHPGSVEYDFVASKFISTYNGKYGAAIPANGLFAAPPIGLGGYQNNGLFGVPNPNPNYGIINNFGMGGGLNAAGGVNGPITGKISKIEKVYNCVLYERFMNEFKRLLRKYPNYQITDLMKHLFHGTRATAPHLIYSSEDGLDMRFSNSGMYGQGVYFADNSQYSHSYHHPTTGR
jgi:Poly(ADP-ribose) polymerase catalytic domain